MLLLATRFRSVWAYVDPSIWWRWSCRGCFILFFRLGWERGRSLRRVVGKWRDLPAWGKSCLWWGLRACCGSQRRVGWLLSRLGASKKGFSLWYLSHWCFASVRRFTFYSPLISLACFLLRSGLVLHCIHLLRRLLLHFLHLLLVHCSILPLSFHFLHRSHPQQLHYRDLCFRQPDLPIMHLLSLLYGRISLELFLMNDSLIRLFMICKSWHLHALSLVHRIRVIVILLPILIFLNLFLFFFLFFSPFYFSLLNLLYYLFFKYSSYKTFSLFSSILHCIYSLFLHVKKSGAEDI